MAGCKHEHDEAWTWWRPPWHDEMHKLSRWCRGCGATLSLGPANDDSEAVQIEIEATHTSVGEPRYWELHAPHIRDCLPCFLARCIRDHDASDPDPSVTTRRGK